MKLMFVTPLTVCCLLVAPARLFANPALERTLRCEAREINQEADPTYEQACFSMGSMTIDYASEQPGVPQAGFRITDPRGREIGYDARSNRGWQEMPLAQAYLDCEQNEDTGELRQCKTHIEICGPISGTYQVELLSIQSGKYSVSVTAESRRTWSGAGYDVTTSQAELQSVVGEQESAVMLLQYSREAGTQIKLFGRNQHVANK